MRNANVAIPQWTKRAMLGIAILVIFCCIVVIVQYRQNRILTERIEQNTNNNQEILFENERKLQELIGELTKNNANRESEHNALQKILCDNQHAIADKLGVTLENECQSFASVNDPHH